MRIARAWGLLAAALTAAAATTVPVSALPASPLPGAEGQQGGIFGAGKTAGGGRFWVDAYADDLDRGGLSYKTADGALVVRCEGFDSYSPIVYVQQGDPAARVTGTCDANGGGQPRPVQVDATFADHSPTGDGDQASITVSENGAALPGGEDGGPISAGNVTVRP